MCSNVFSDMQKGNGACNKWEDIEKYGGTEGL